MLKRGRAAGDCSFNGSKDRATFEGRKLKPLCLLQSHLAATGGYRRNPGSVNQPALFYFRVSFATPFSNQVAPHGVAITSLGNAALLAQRP